MGTTHLWQTVGSHLESLVKLQTRLFTGYRDIITGITMITIMIACVLLSLLKEKYSCLAALFHAGILFTPSFKKNDGPSRHCVYFVCPDEISSPRS